MVSSFAISPIARVLLLHGNHSRLIGFKVYVHRFSRPEEKNKILGDSFLGNGGQLFRWCRMQDSNPYEITNGSYVLHSPFFPLEEQSVSDRNRTENSVQAQCTKICQSIAYIGFCGRAADGHGKRIFATCQMMVFHQSEPPSFLQAL